MPSWLRSFGALALVAALVAGCTTGAATHTAGASPQPSMSRPATPSGPACLSGLHYRSAVATSSGPITVALLGSGRRGVVLANESDEDLCAWLPFARQLTDSGFRVALFDYAADPVDDIAAVSRTLRGIGVRSVALIGASEGAKASIIAAAERTPHPALVVTLSAEAELQGKAVADDAKRLASPALFVTAADDPYGATQATRGFYRSAPAAVKKLVVVPGSAHGTALLADPDVTRAITAFLTAHGD